MENNKIKLITIADNEPQTSSIIDVSKDKNLANDISILDEYCKGNAVMAMASI